MRTPNAVSGHTLSMINMPARLTHPRPCTPPCARNVCRVCATLRTTPTNKTVCRDFSTRDTCRLCGWQGTRALVVCVGCSRPPLLSGRRGSACVGVEPHHPFIHAHPPLKPYLSTVPPPTLPTHPMHGRRAAIERGVCCPLHSPPCMPPSDSRPFFPSLAGSAATWWSCPSTSTLRSFRPMRTLTYTRATWCEPRDGAVGRLDGGEVAKRCLPWVAPIDG